MFANSPNDYHKEYTYLQYYMSYSYQKSNIYDHFYKKLGSRLFFRKIILYYNFAPNGKIQLNYTSFTVTMSFSEMTFQLCPRSSPYSDRNIKGILWILPIITLKFEIMNFVK